MLHLVRNMVPQEGSRVSDVCEIPDDLYNLVEMECQFFPRVWRLGHKLDIATLETIGRGSHT